MDTNKHESEEIGRNPPNSNRVVKRALVLASLCCRGAIEQDAADPKAEQFRQTVFDWLKRVGAESELEPVERTILLSPLGKLSREQHAFATWQAEGMAVLAWALHLTGLPDYEAVVNAKSVADSLGWLTDGADKLLVDAQVRDAKTIQALADKLFALDWRLADFQLQRKSLNFSDFAKTAWFGPLNVEGLRFMNGDLSIGGYAISEAGDEARSLRRLITINRRRAAEWLLGQNETYSEVDLST